MVDRNEKNSGYKRSDIFMVNLVMVVVELNIIMIIICYSDEL